MLKSKLSALNDKLEGFLASDKLTQSLYATDASVYRELPLGVVFPKTVGDIQLCIQFAQEHRVTLIPRTAGTSLAGQCVGEGLVIDVSRYFNSIGKVDLENKTITVQPGVIRDDLNRHLEPYGLFFGPNTSTSNRCMIGGMVGNNSSGTTSIQYGVTRDKVIALDTVLSDGSIVTFQPLSKDEFSKKLTLETLEGSIYRHLNKTLSSEKNKQLIRQNFPKNSIHRRNTGYALDALLTNEVFSNNTTQLNLCKILAGSEGTLAFNTNITLQLDNLPPNHSAMVALHFHSIENCLKAVSTSMKSNLYTCEMMDKVILDCTKDNLMYAPLRSFVQGDPKAILLCELRYDNLLELEKHIQQFLANITKTGLSYAQVVLKDDDITKALELRKAGLGLLGNMVGDHKAVACIEDTAVALEDLSGYIDEFTKIMKSYNQKAVYYAHAGAGELHLRPILNLKNKNDVSHFRAITTAVAKLVKKYQGSMSGEHGDGRLRAEFIEYMVGKDCYALLKQVKHIFDPNSVFNAGKIINAPLMDTSLRYVPDRIEPDIKTLLSFKDSEGILRLAEKCNGSADCRKSVDAGGTMCPSYRATKNEKDTTRGRANALREFLTQSNTENPFNHNELKDVFNLCISCKGCKSECPSNVDVSALKAEFEYQYQEINGYSFRNRSFANSTTINKYLSILPQLSNTFLQNQWVSGFIKKTLGIAKDRSLPQVSKQSFRRYLSKTIPENKSTTPPKKCVYLFVDEFTNYLESTIGEDCVFLLTKLDYTIKTVPHPESGRALISKGFLKQAKVLANKNIDIFSELISEETPLIGIEPSAILSFRDEYLRLADNTVKAQQLAKHCYTIEEFISNEVKAQRIREDQFTLKERRVKLHVHCHQKALSNQKFSFDVLNLPKNYKVTIIPSGCCGMAGSFGYEKEHFDVSMTIAEQTLLPAVRKTPPTTLIAASGTSCRHQIKDAVSRESKHPISILREALA